MYLQHISIALNLFLTIPQSSLIWTFWPRGANQLSGVLPDPVFYILLACLLYYHLNFQCFCPEFWQKWALFSIKSALQGKSIFLLQYSNLIRWHYVYQTTNFPHCQFGICTKLVGSKCTAPLYKVSSWFLEATHPIAPKAPTVLFIDSLECLVYIFIYTLGSKK